MLLLLYVVASLGLSDFQSFALVVQISLKCQLGLHVHVWGRQQFPKCLLLHLVLDSTFWTRVNFQLQARFISCINVQEKLILLQVKVP